MRCAKRDRREVRGLLPIPLLPSTLVCAASGQWPRRSLGNKRGREASESLTREQTRQGSVRIQAKYSGLLSEPRRGWDRFRRTGTTRFGGRPRGNGALRRNGTRLLSTIPSVVF